MLSLAGPTELAIGLLRAITMTCLPMVLPRRRLIVQIVLYLTLRQDGLAFFAIRLSNLAGKNDAVLLLDELMHSTIAGLKARSTLQSTLFPT